MNEIQDALRSDFGQEYVRDAADEIDRLTQQLAEKEKALRAIDILISHIIHSDSANGEIREMAYRISGKIGKAQSLPTKERIR